MQADKAVIKGTEDFTPRKHCRELFDAGVDHPLTHAVRFWPPARVAEKRRSRRARMDKLRTAPGG